MAHCHIDQLRRNRTIEIETSKLFNDLETAVPDHVGSVSTETRDPMETPLPPGSFKMNRLMLVQGLKDVSILLGIGVLWIGLCKYCLEDCGTELVKRTHKTTIEVITMILHFSFQRKCIPNKNTHN